MSVNLIQLETEFQKKLDQIESAPWLPLKCLQIDRLYQWTAESCPPSSITVYKQELDSHLWVLFAGLQKNPIPEIPPPVLRRLINHLYNADTPAENEILLTDVVIWLSKIYLRFNNFEELTSLLTESGYLPAENTAKNIQSLTELQTYLSEPLATAICRDIHPNLPASSSLSVHCLFAAHRTDIACGILGKLTLENVEIKSRGKDRLNLVSHNIDFSKNIAEQSEVIFSFLRQTHKIKNKKPIHLDFSINQPPSSIRGTSIGLPLLLLSEIGLQRYLKNEFSQPAFYDDVVMTGAVDSTAKVLPVHNRDIKFKIEAAFYSAIRIMVLPEVNYAAAKQALKVLRDQHPQQNLTLIPVSSLNQIFMKPEILHLKSRKFKDRLSQFYQTQRHRAHLWYIVTFLLLLITGYFGIVKNPVPDEIISNKDKLVVKNRYGFTLWMSESFGKNISPLSVNDISEVHDLNNDNNPEILIGYGFNAGPNSGHLICYNAKGETLWDHTAGEETQFGDNIYSDNFTVSKILVEDINNDSIPEIIITAHHTYFPCVLRVLSNKGEELSSYWHSGFINALNTIEYLPDNNTKEIIFAGTNNEYTSSVIGVLNPITAIGASYQNKQYYRKYPYTRGNELVYLKLPLTHFARYTNYDNILKMMISENNEVNVFIVNSGVRNPDNNKLTELVYYTFGPNLSVKFVDLTNHYYLQYQNIFPDEPPIPYNDKKTMDYFRTVSYRHEQR